MEAQIPLLILQLVANGMQMYAQYQTAAAAKDQATLDAIQRQIIAASDAMAPPGAAITPVIQS